MPIRATKSAAQPSSTAAPSATEIASLKKGLSALDSQDKAIDFLKSRGGEKAKWTARMGVEKGGARHSLTNLYANGKYAGSLQLFVLGPALYNNKKQAGYTESAATTLSWEQVKTGVQTTYQENRPWGAGWICHDFTSKLHQSWGKEVTVPSATASGPLYAGGRVLGTVLSPGTALGMAVHRGLNNLKDGVEGLKRGWGQHSKAVDGLKKAVTK
jgi:hypothetical protein